MTDRILNSAWWLAVMSMICVAAGAALFVGYRGLFDLLGQRWLDGSVSMSVSILSGLAAYLLCRHRNDLL